MVTEKLTAIIRLKKLLPSITRFSFSASTGNGSKTGWRGAGSGTVKACSEPLDFADDDLPQGSILFHETGEFTLDGQTRSVKVKNVYRWHFSTDGLTLSHERFGQDAAVVLFDLVNAGEFSLTNRAAHQCVDDAYSASLNIITDGFDLTWNIVGPKKNETIRYEYRIG